VYFVKSIIRNLASDTKYRAHKVYHISLYPIRYGVTCITEVRQQISYYMSRYYHYSVIFFSAVNDKDQFGVQYKLLFENVLNLNFSKNFFLFLCDFLKTIRIN